MKYCVFSLIISFTNATNATEQTPFSSGRQLKDAFTGNMVQGSMDGAGRYIEFYAKDGTVRSKEYQAKWSIEGDQMCWVYEGQPQDCWRASIKGNRVCREAPRIIARLPGGDSKLPKILEAVQV